MLLSELVVLKEDALDGKYYGIVVDTYTSDIPDFVKEIGFLAAREDDNASIKFDLLDMLISCEPLPLKAVLEVPFEIVDHSNTHLGLDADEWLMLATNCVADISFLPPSDQTEENIALYAELLGSISARWAQESTMPAFIYPISSFVIYLTGEAFGYLPEQIATDSYVKSSFVDGIKNPVDMDIIKDHVRSELIEVAGENGSLDSFFHSLGAAVFQGVKKQVESIKESQE